MNRYHFKNVKTADEVIAEREKDLLLNPPKLHIHEIIEREMKIMNEISIKEYERGRWDMFEEITNAIYGKQCYFLQDDNETVYSRISHKEITKDEAEKEFIDWVEEL